MTYALVSTKKSDVTVTLCKAFDAVSHTHLLLRLKQLGSSRNALKWFDSYLTGREQLVTAHVSGYSAWLNTNLGVSQESVLEPLLFCLDINDVTDALDQSRIRHLLYAKELQMYEQILRGELNEGIGSLEKEASSV